jgi:hypothetical protein
MPQPEPWQRELHVKFALYGTRASSLVLEYKEQLLDVHMINKACASVILVKLTLTSCWRNPRGYPRIPSTLPPTINHGRLKECNKGDEIKFISTICR